MLKSADVPEPLLPSLFVPHECGAPATRCSSIEVQFLATKGSLTL